MPHSKVLPLFHLQTLIPAGRQGPPPPEAALTVLSPTPQVEAVPPPSPSHIPRMYPPTLPSIPHKTEYGTVTPGSSFIRHSSVKGQRKMPIANDRRNSASRLVTKGHSSVWYKGQGIRERGSRKRSRIPSQLRASSSCHCLVREGG